MDGAMTKAPLGGEGTGANLTDRGKKGTKRSLLTEGNGIPLAVAVDGANRPSFCMCMDNFQSGRTFRIGSKVISANELATVPRKPIQTSSF